MSKSKSKIKRYSSLLQRIENWQQYLWRKIIGFEDFFDFRVKGFESIRVSKNMMAPFRENFLDDIYFKNIPPAIFQNKRSLVIIDIGANVGFFSLAALSKFPNAQIYAFEPHPFCYKTLHNYQNTFEQYAWNIYNQAVSDHSGTLAINTNSIDAFATMSSVFQRNPNQEVFHAKTIRLDSFLDQHQVKKVDFIKLDCEGAEYSILYSLSPVTFKKISSLCIETHKGEQENENINAMNQYIQEMGYTTEMLDEGEYSGYIWAWK